MRQKRSRGRTSGAPGGLAGKLTREMALPPVTHRADRHQFEIALDEGVAVAAYAREGRRLVLTHTHVPAAREDEGLGSALAQAAFDYARGEGLKVVPACAFMAAWAERHPEYGDVVADAPARP